ncbi:MAG: glycoside hydrolase family 5 protein, partial [Bacteroidota bacterium]
MNHLLLLLLFFALPLTSFAQLTPAEAVAGMGRGINLGNTLEPPTEGGWNNGPAQESHFDAYLAAGFSNVRIPVRWDQHTGNSVPFA